MKHFPWRAAAAVLAGSLTLAACGGGGGGFGRGGDSPPGTPGPASEVPASAQQSVAGLIAYLKELIAASSDTSEPVVLGNAALPVDDTAEPAPVP